MAVILVIAIEAVLVGAVLLWRGWRGVRGGDHPTCRRCNFDLFGRPADSTVCPECGADVTRKRAIVTGQRQRRGGLAVTGAIVLVLGLAASGLFGWQVGRTVEWQRYKPVAWLLRETGSANAPTRNAALQELLSRLGASQLSRPQVDRVVDAALKAQGNAAIAWTTDWGDFVEQARKSKLVSDQQWQKYIEQAVTTSWLSLNTRSLRNPQEQFAYRLLSTNARVGKSATYYASVRQSGVVIDGRVIDESDESFRGSMMMLSSRSRSTVSTVSEPLRRVTQSLPLGVHRGHIAYDIHVSDQPPAPRARPMPTLPPGIDERTRRMLETRRAEYEAARLRRTASTNPAPSTLLTVNVQLPLQFELTDRELSVEERLSDVPTIADAMATPGNPPFAWPTAARYAPSAILELPGPRSLPTSAPASASPAEATELLADVRERQARVREKLLEVSAEDRDACAKMLKLLPNTGIIKLVPRDKYDDGDLGIRGGGACYSFARKTYDYPDASDIQLGSGRFTAGFAGRGRGYFLPLGDISVEDIATARSFPPDWADAEMRRHWPMFWNAMSFGSSEIVDESVRLPAPSVQRGMPAEAGQAYLLRSVSPGRSDVLVGLRVIRKYDDGSVVVAFRVLREFQRAAR